VAYYRAGEHGRRLGARGKRLDRGALQPLADDHEIDRRQGDERDHHAMALQADEIADGEKSRRDQPKRASRHIAISRPEEREIDPVA
jgi:hypothetical protein